MIKLLLFLLFLTKNLGALENIDFIVVNKEKRNITMYKEGKVLKKFKAFELFLFSNATIPEKYFDKFLESKSSKLALLECKGF